MVTSIQWTYCISSITSTCRI